MGGGGGKGADYDLDEMEVKEPDPVAPPSPASRGSREAAYEAEDVKRKEKKKFGQSKTILSRGLTTQEENSDTLG